MNEKNREREVTLVSYNLRKKRDLGTESLSSRIEDMAALSFLLTSEFNPPMETSSPYAAGCSVPPNEMGIEPLRTIITYC